MFQFLIKIVLFPLVIFPTAFLLSQDTILLMNPSFEDLPRRGKYFANGQTIAIQDWVDCGFPNESPPDIHPTNEKAWGVTLPAEDGKTYLGLVARYNLTWESVSQQLQHPIKPGHCYLFKASLAISNTYTSPTKRSKDRVENFSHALVLQIWGGSDYCQRGELLAKSPPIINTTWREFSFLFNSTTSWDYFFIEAFYYFPSDIREDKKTAYNGHILVDNLSPITEIFCTSQ